LRSHNNPNKINLIFFSTALALILINYLEHGNKIMLMGTEGESNMKKPMIAVGLLLILVIATPSYAIPSLQLDIQGGTYNSATETVISTSNPFTLYAYLIPDGEQPNGHRNATTTLTDTYFISAAITPGFGPIGGNLGSVIINGVPINVTSDMVYGNAPLDTTYAGQDHDAGDLPPHDIFPTFFTQIAFTFDSNLRATAYNTQDTPGVGPTPNPSGDMYYQYVTVDTSDLDPNYFIHFDLYNSLTIPVTERVCTGQGRSRSCIDVVRGNDIDINSFAPFSHDAQSDGHQVPEPSSLWLMGMGLLGLGFFGRKDFRK
jgi:hypothetical protein